MQKLSENHNLRKFYLESDQAPPLSMIMKKMSPPLAKIYFTSMVPALKVVAGLEPPLKGGGKAWYTPPEDELSGKIVVKPLTKECCRKLSHNGMQEIGYKLWEMHQIRMKSELCLTNEIYYVRWAEVLEEKRHEYWEECTAIAEKENTDTIRDVYDSISNLYSTSLNKVQDLLLDAAVKNIQIIREEATNKMQTHYEYLLRHQAMMVKNRYEKKLQKEKARLKAIIKQSLIKSRQTLAYKLHDTNLEKHTAIEKIRQYLNMKNVACQVYVALKEQEENKKELTLCKNNLTKSLAILEKTITIKDCELNQAEKKEKKQQECNTLWGRKIRHVVHNLQMFISYCLRIFPEHAEFFINTEKLILLQLAKALEDRKVDSFIVMDVESLQTLEADPHPFYLFCDKVDQDLCPKDCTLNPTRMPVIVINKRCMYSACENFKISSSEIKDDVKITNEGDSIMEDSHDYSRGVPVKYTASQQLQELKLKSSLLQLLQQEIPNVRALHLECASCKIPHCFDCDVNRTATISIGSQLLLDEEKTKTTEQSTIPSSQSAKKIQFLETDLDYERQPKWPSYSRHVESKKCDCAKMAKTHLLENLPAYMRNMSKYDEPELLNYEKCTVSQLKSLVTNAKSKEYPPASNVSPKTKEIATQYSDQEFDYLCTCFSEESIKYLLHSDPFGHKKSELSLDNQFRVVGDSISQSYLLKDDVSFATDRALSVIQLLKESPDIKEMFEKKSCS